MTSNMANCQIQWMERVWFTNLATDSFILLHGINSQELTKQLGEIEAFKDQLDMMVPWEVLR